MSFYWFDDRMKKVFCPGGELLKVCSLVDVSYLF